MPSVRYLTNCTPEETPRCLPRHPAIQPLRPSTKKIPEVPIWTSLTPLCDCQDSPESAVDTTPPDLRATHERASSSTKASDLAWALSKGWRSQVAPPSSVLSVKPPRSAMIQPSFGLVKLTWIRSRSSATSRLRAVQVRPPSEVLRISPRCPTAQPVWASVKSTLRMVTLNPESWVCQVSPPSEVATMAPSWPTAQPRLGSTKSMSSRTEVTPDWTGRQRLLSPDDPGMATSLVK